MILKNYEHNGVFCKEIYQKKENEKILAFERHKLGVSCSRVCTNKKSGLIG